MAPFRRESFNSSLPSLESLSSSEHSQFSYYHEDDEVMDASYRRTNESSPIGKRRKRVSFSEYSMLRLIPNIDCYSDEEREAMYLTEEDMERIQKENLQTIEEIRKGNLPNTSSDYFRGLECRGNGHLCNQKRAMREITLSLIISEQHECEEICPDWIEHVYSTITEDSVARAKQMALLDAESVLNEVTVVFTRIKSKLQIDWMQQKVGAIIQ